MSPDPVTALARKWCQHPGTHGDPSTGCACGEIAAAVREALEEAEKVCDGHGDPACLAAVKRDIAALRGGTG